MKMFLFLVFRLCAILDFIISLPAPESDNCHELCGTGTYHATGKCQISGRCLCWWGWSGANGEYIRHKGPLKNRLLADYCTFSCHYTHDHSNPLCENLQCTVDGNKQFKCQKAEVTIPPMTKQTTTEITLPTSIPTTTLMPPLPEDKSTKTQMPPLPEDDTTTPMPTPALPTTEENLTTNGFGIDLKES